MCVKALSFSVEYSIGKEGGIESGLWAKDMDYFRSKVRVNRSNNTTMMTQTDGRYFEATYALLEIMDYIHKYIIQLATRVDVNVDSSNNKTNVIIAGYPEGVNRMNSNYITIDMGYSITDECPLGRFVINVISGYPPNDINSVKAFDVQCGKTLCYSENFPAPSVLISKMKDAVRPFSFEQ